MTRWNVRALAHVDWMLLGASTVLVIVGLVALASVTIAKTPPDWNTFLRQVIFLGIGAFLALMAILIDYRMVRGFSGIAYVIAIALLVAVLIFGTTINGTKGWFNFAGVSFQPVEFVKLLWVVAFAAYLARYARAFDQWRHLFISGAFALGLVILILQQPDLGSALVVAGTYVGLLLMANVRRSQILLLVSLLIIGSVLSYVFLLQDYQKNRIRVLVNPTAEDRLESGYNVTQSIIAVGSGQVFGRGFGQGTQSQLNFLPEQQTDFIFAVLAEEFGLIGVIVLLGSFTIVLTRSVRIAQQSRDDFGAFLCTGISIGLAIHLFINVGMNMGLVPVTGIPLPFVSSGGSSLVASLLGVGLVQSVAVRRRSAGI